MISKENLTWSVYILRCSDGSYYVGVASDVAHRVQQHNSGQGPAFTKKRRPAELVYVENCESYLAARRREKQIKGWRREKKEWLIAGFLRLVPPEAGLAQELASSPGLSVFCKA